MMAVSDLLKQLQALDVRIWAEDDRLRLDAPKGALTPELREALAARKAEILTYLNNLQTADRLPALVSVGGQGLLPLSFAQKRMWLLQQMDQGTGAYNISQAVRLRGALNVEALALCLNAIVQRHAILRTTYRVVDGMPFQEVNAIRPLPLPVIDLTASPTAQAEVQKLIRAEAIQPFDLERDWPIRVKLLRVAAADHILLTTIHHIASDGSAFAVLGRELVALYENYAAHGSLDGVLPPLPIQYADYAVWEEKLLQSDFVAGQLAYWQEQLGGQLPELDLPTDYGRSPVRTFHGARLDMRLSRDLSQQLRQFCQAEGVTLFVALLAAFKLLLHRYTGQEDIVVGSPIVGRSRAELEKMIGLFLNTLALRTDLSGEPSYRELVGRVRQVGQGAISNQDVPFEMVLEALKTSRDLSRTPLFQVFFNVLNFSRRVDGFSSLEVEVLVNPEPDSLFDVTLYVEEIGEQIDLHLAYNTDLFKKERMEALLAHFSRVLEQAVENPDRCLEDFSLLTEGEREKLLVAWNDTAVPVNLICLHHMFENQAAQTPDAAALIFEGACLSYEELNRRANRLAHYLRQVHQVGPGVLVAIGLERSWEMVIGILGVLKAGGAYVPLDPTHPESRLADILADTRASLLLTQVRPLANLPAFAGTIIHLDRAQELLAGQPDTNPEPLAALNDLAYVVYTSGSTGKPKGVLAHHRGVAHHLTFLANHYGVTQRDVVVQIPTVSFDASVRDTFTPLISGAKVIILNEAEAGDPRAIVARMRDHGVTCILSIVPSLLGQLLMEAAKLPWPKESLRLLLTSGESLSLAYCRQAKEIFGAALEVVNQYGPTECTMTSTYHRVHDQDDNRQYAFIGRPIANTQVYLLDKYLNLVPTGAPGEVHIGGMGVSYGYLNRPELTAEKFIPHPFSDDPAARLYKTGDHARYLADGTLEFIGRIDNQVKIRGFRVELGEIEVALLAHTAVREAVAIMREDQPGDKRLVAYVILHETETPPDQAALRGFVAETLPAYMVPAAFVYMDEFPKTPNRKIDRKALPMPDLSRDVLGRQYVAPRTEVEEIVAQVMAESLNLEKVGIWDNFFELGGHSLLVTRLLFRITELFHVELQLRHFFENPTVAGTVELLLADSHDRPRIERTAQLLIKLSRLSDEEVAAMLKSKGSV